MPWVCDMALEDMLDEDAAPRACRAIADAAGDELHDRTRRNTPVGRPELPGVNARGGRRPGTLRDSIERGPVEPWASSRGAGFRVRVSTSDPVAPYVEHNTRPHEIRPRKDRAPATVVATGKSRGTVKDGRASLSWVGPGGRVFAKVVHHPGTRGAHMFTLSALEMEGGVTLHRLAEPALRRFALDLSHNSFMAGLARA